MAEFYAAVTTNLGVSLSADLLTGEQIEFTKLVAGGGNYTEEELVRTELQKATALRNQKQEFGFSSIEKVTDSCVLLKTLLSNEQLEAGYRMTEIGVYARKPGEEGDGILYSVAVAKEADYFPPYNGLAAVEIIEDYYISVSDAENVTIQTGRDTPVLTEEFEKFKEDVEEKFETIPKVVIGPEETEIEEKDVLLVTESGKVKKVRKAGTSYPIGARASDVDTDSQHQFVSQAEKNGWNAKPDPTSPVNQNVVNFVMAATRSMILSGEDLGTLFSKLARWLNDLASVALSGSYNDLTNRPNLGAAASQGVANNDTTTQAGYLADARIVRQHGLEIDQISSDLAKVKVYVGGDGKLHFVNSGGADSVLPFSKSYTLPQMVFQIQDSGGSDDLSKLYLPLLGASKVSFTFWKNNYGSPTATINYSDGSTQQVFSLGRGQTQKNYDVNLTKEAVNIYFTLPYDSTVAHYIISNFTVS